ncbi:MAG TPA: Rieske 2Fe-2S domain-containing protein [Ktedonobacterales bacterium]|jgi:cytochrome b6-f complex iron-sulfur subunit|nr:Rieske 2Fe-2S domain-containing protein [Ktedonobacterales bacterium]
MSIDTNRTPQEYEVLSGGGAESAQMARRGITRRQVLRRAVTLGLGVVGIEGTYMALTMLYPNLAGQFGSVITLSNKSKYQSAAQKQVLIDQRGIFYEPSAKTYIMHLTKDGADFALQGQTLQNNLDASNWLQDQDGTYWLSLYQVCVHLGCKVPFRDDCVSFKCPCHGSHYNVDGEYLDGPAPRSLDRFTMSFDGSGNVQVNTGKLNQHIQRPDAQTRILVPPTVQCSA